MSSRSSADIEQEAARAQEQFGFSPSELMKKEDPVSAAPKPKQSSRPSRRISAKSGPAERKASVGPKPAGTTGGAEDVIGQILAAQGAAAVAATSTASNLQNYNTTIIPGGRGGMAVSSELDTTLDATIIGGTAASGIMLGAGAPHQHVVYTTTTVPESELVKQLREQVASVSAELAAAQTKLTRTEHDLEENDARWKTKLDRAAMDHQSERDAAELERKRWQNDLDRLKETHAEDMRHLQVCCRAVVLCRGLSYFAGKQQNKFFSDLFMSTGRKCCAQHFIPVEQIAEKFMWPVLGIVCTDSTLASTSIFYYSPMCRQFLNRVIASRHRSPRRVPCSVACPEQEHRSNDHRESKRNNTGTAHIHSRRNPSACCPSPWIWRRSSCDATSSGNRATSRSGCGESSSTITPRRRSGTAGRWRWFAPPPRRRSRRCGGRSARAFRSTICWRRWARFAHNALAQIQMGDLLKNDSGPVFFLLQCVFASWVSGKMRVLVAMDVPVGVSRRDRISAASAPACDQCCGRRGTPPLIVGVVLHAVPTLDDDRLPIAR